MCVPEGKVYFLGHMVDSSGIHIQSDKIEAMKQFPQSRSVENVRSFLGSCGYYRPFISGFAKIAFLLHQLVKKGVRFHLDAPQQNSFEALKTALTNSPMLQFPKYTQPFLIFTDALSMGLRVVLMRRSGSPTL